MSDEPNIAPLIRLIRDARVILDADLAQLYGVETRALNQALKRNQERFPDDFAFELTRDEILGMSQTVISLRNLKFSKQVRAFTEHGALMAASLLNSPRAVAMSVYVIRAFVRMREDLAANAAIFKRLAEIDQTLLLHDSALRDIYRKLRPLLEQPPLPPKPEIGFHVKEDAVPYRVKPQCPRVLATALLAGLLAMAHCAAADPAPTPPGKGTVLFETGFEGTNALAGWTGTAQLTAGFQSAQAVCFEAASARENVGIQLKLDSREWRGCMVRGSAMIKAENVSAKPNAWNGIKFMLALETPDQRLWPQAPAETGSSDWRRVAFTVRVPINTTAATLHLGLEQVAGKVWFDDVKFTVVKPPRSVNPVPFSAPTFTGHDLPRLRGTMVSSQIDAASLRVLGREWNANLIRWQLTRPSRPGQTNSPAEYDAWLEGELRRFDAALPECERDGLMVVLDLHSPPGGKGTDGGYAGSDNGLFTDRQAQEKFIEVWTKLATRYRGAKAIWGYDLANEPVEEFVEEGCDDWHDLAERAARAIREIDPTRALIVEAPPWGGPASLADFAPLAVSNVVYSVHMYEPIAFTHQGVFRPSGPVSYPGEVAGKMWNRQALEAALQPAIAFQHAWNVQIYLGEFSAIRWAPGDSARRYLADVIAIAEEHGWDWSYHAFREWQGWSVEHGGDRADTQPAAVPTDREQLLRSWFARNQKPKW